MSEHFFGLHPGHLAARADAIAKRHGAYHVNHTESDGRKRGWFACPNRGEPFNGDTATRVMGDIHALGGVEAFREQTDGEPLRLCAHPDGCTNVAAIGDSFCTGCRSAINRERGHV